VNQFEYLDLEDLLSLVVHLGVGPVRDVGLLDSSAARPKSSAFGQDVYPTLDLKAAALLHSVAKNHALVDGNKRLAWLAAVVFLDLNGHQPELTDDAAFELVWQVAGEAVDVEAIARRLQVRPSPPGGYQKAT
jgi:death-on-curing protein